MSAALERCLAIHAAHARLRYALDEELGLHHGLDFDDFVLLERLASSADGRAGFAPLGRLLGVRPSALLRRLLALEKTGLVQRAGQGADRGVLLRAAARPVVQAARDTVARIGERAATPVPVAGTGAG